MYVSKTRKCCVRARRGFYFPQKLRLCLQHARRGPPGRGRGTGGDSGGAWTAKCSKFIGRVFKNWGPHNSSVVIRLIRHIRLARTYFRNWAKTAVRRHPSSRAGGQDDVSYTNSLKLNIQKTTRILIYTAIHNWISNKYLSKCVAYLIFMCIYIII